MQDVLNHLATAREELNTDDDEAEELYADLEALEQRARATLATRALGEQAGADRAVLEDSGDTLKLAVYVTDPTEFKDALTTSGKHDSPGERVDEVEDDAQPQSNEETAESGDRSEFTEAERDVLAALEEHGELTVNELKSKSGRGDYTRNLLTRLSKKNAISKRSDPADGRRNLYSLPDEEPPVQDDETAGETDDETETDTSPEEQSEGDEENAPEDTESLGEETEGEEGDEEADLADRWPSALDVAEQRVEDEDDLDEELLEGLPDKLPSVEEIRSVAKQSDIRTLDGFADELGIQDKSIARIVAMRLDLYDKELDRPEGEPNPTAAGGDD